MKLNEAGVTLIDCDHKTPAAQASGYPYVGIPQLKDGHIRLDGARLISEEDFVLWTKKAKPQLNDVILSRRCNPGESAYVPDSLEIALGQNLVLLRSDGSVIYPPFLRWLVQGNEWWEQVNKFLNVGAVFNSLKCKDIPNFKLTIPSLKEQKRITDILSGLDKKIELNNKINQNLESIAQAIFKSWFIDFDPVRAKIAAKQEGKDPELAAMCAISGKSEAELKQMSEEDFAELQATATLFPDELVESELGEVPKGWELQQFKDIAKYTSNKISLNDLTLENYISTENMLSEKKGIEKASSLPKVNSVPAFKKGNILVSNIRPYFKKIWFSSSEGGHSNDVLNFEVLEEGCEEYLYNLIYQDSFFDQMMASSKGSKMPRGDKKAIMSFQVVIPSITLRRLYSRKVEKFYFKKNVIEKENQILKIIRDTLLPKLLSGEINVSSLKDKVE
ncbi:MULTISPECIES: restriction endonuclease subunit S [Acinetobacter]|uniref:restriction endonuclease subunit S n=1 Tax=Acinetobacter TaxID=469 RepID=UPI0025BD42A4|nr:restriction endonuclease subunit S [Acinetobacter sp. UBA6720]